MRSRPRSIPKGASRLEFKTAKDKADVGKLEAWKRAVFALDKFRCRKCGAKVTRTLERVPHQAQAHHVKGRVEKLVRYDVRNGLCVCGACHDQITGAVNEKWIVVGTKFFTLQGRAFINAREPVTFERVA
jgi:predicted restriction endonuclease